MNGKKRFCIALAGNPNSGKTTLFNAMTGSRQHVGNYPGVTVEIKEGTARLNGAELTVIDLPGTYSLSAYSEEERIARSFIQKNKPDAVINVLDASNLERNLYLAVQIMEMGIPVILAFNMSDIAHSRGIEFDYTTLSKLLGAPIVPTTANKNIGTKELLEKAVVISGRAEPAPLPGFTYGTEIENAISKIDNHFPSNLSFHSSIEKRWTAIKLLENDPEMLDRLSTHTELIGIVKEEQHRIEKIFGDTAEVMIADHRYGFISGACQEAVKSTVESRHTASDRIDQFVLHRIWGLPVFMGLMYAVFWLTFTVGAPAMGWIESLFEMLATGISGLWPEGAASILQSLLVDGIIGGVGGVLIFLPNILLLFMAIAILEDSGYMARAAFLMDRLMHKIGLHGKSFIPMLIGFGCSVPAIMATRTLENRRDRLTTMLVVPLMSCGARLPIYALIIPAFFPKALHAPMLWVIYLIGIVLAIVCAKLLRMTLFKGESVPFVMELPPYRMPTCQGVLLHMWERGGLYVKKAGTLILAISIILWALTSFPKTETTRAGLSPEEQRAAELSNTIAGRIGHAMEPVIKPLGFDWRIGTAMIGAFAAKEVFVAQMGIVYSVGEADEESEPLRDQLKANYTPLVGFCIMLFMLISAPCMATIAVTKRESNSWKWALFQLGGLTLLAYVITLIVYQLGTLFSIGVGG